MFILNLFVSNRALRGTPRVSGGKRHLRWSAGVLGGALIVAGLGCEERQEDIRAEPESPAVPPAAVEPADAPGPVVEDPSYELRATAEPSYRVDEEGQFEIRLAPKAGWHVNQEYPISVQLSGQGVELPEELGQADAAEFGDDEARFEVRFTSEEAGQHRVRADVDFAVCTPENCMPDRRTLALVLPVEAGD